MIELNFEKMGGLVPAIAQDVKTGEVLMLAFMNQAAWESDPEDTTSHLLQPDPRHPCG